MRQYTCSVRHGDSPLHVTANKIVTIAEIAVLRLVHGAGAILDLRPHKLDGKPVLGLNEFGQPRSDAEERERLSRTYDNATPGESEGIVSRLFGPLAALPKTLREVGIDAATQAQEMKAKAAAMAAAAVAMLDDDEPPEADVDDVFDEDEEAA